MLELQCSIARGVGDELSDLDLGMAVRDDDWEGFADELPARLGAIASTVDLLAHTIPEWGSRPHRRIFAQYHDGRQIDFVVQPASAASGRVPGAVVLHDPDKRLAEQRVPSVAVATVENVREWELLAWESLANAGKYLERRSPWEALARLNGARDLVLRSPPRWRMPTSTRSRSPPVPAPSSCARRARGLASASARPSL